MHVDKVRLQDSLIGGTINALINGAIAYASFKSMSSVPLSLDMISNDEVSVWGQAVSLTFGLGIILSLITSYLFIKALKQRFPSKSELINSSFWHHIIPIALANSAALFGWFVAAAVIWTKYIGEVYVSVITAAILVGFFAFIVTIFIEMRTKSHILYRKINILEKVR